MTIDIDAYFRRIGYSGTRAPTLDTLRAIHALHPQTIAFENLDPLLGRPVRLDAASLQDKLVHDGRGGYCFEHNLLFGHVLKALGFDTRWLAGRVLWLQPDIPVLPRTHMLLLVTIDREPYIADVGFGGMTLTAPLRFVPDIEQSTPHESFRIVARDGGFVLQAKVRDSWSPLYWFDLQEQILPDYEMANWYQCTHPSSLFTAGLIIARSGADRRYALRDNVLTVHHAGTSERRVLRTPDELRAALAGPLGLKLPEAPALDDILKRMTAGTA